MNPKTLILFLLLLTSCSVKLTGSGDAANGNSTPTSGNTTTEVAVSAAQMEVTVDENGIAQSESDCSDDGVCEASVEL